MAASGRHSQSIADIEHELYKIFNQHPNSHINDSGEPAIPADTLVDVFRAFSDVYNGVQLMTNDEMDMLRQLLASNPGLEVTPEILLSFIREKTKQSPPRSPLTDEEMELPGPSSGYPQTPTSAKGPSPFDTERRQRTTPLSNNAPSSWTKRPAPAHRRKSDAGSRSDSESFSSSPSSFGRTPGRHRAPSNPPSSPGSMSPDMSGSFSPISSPPFRSMSRPHSRARSQPQSHFGSMYHDDEQDDDRNSDYHNDDTFINSISSLSMPRKPDDNDSDEEESSLGLVMDRSAASSTASMEPLERLDALQRANTELGRKLMEAERTLQNKLSDHEMELEEMQGRMDEIRSELSATKREEKELRTKERQNMTQVAALEVETAKITKALEHSRMTYTSLQRQYQEQCAASEKYRDDLRQREEVIRNLREAASLQEVEVGKWVREREGYELQIARLEEDLFVAQQAHTQLDEQKQENLLLKETIDRMRFEMDEMRLNATAAGGSRSGESSAANTMSKSLGAELMGKMGWGVDDEASDEDIEDDGSSATAVDIDEDDTEGEDVIQTIITRTKRKVASRANKVETRTFEEVKEYSDSSTQYEADAFTTTISTQTDPPPKILTSSSSIQTDERSVEAFAVQTDPEPVPAPRITTEMEIQTDEIEVEVSRSPSPQNAESMASSSTTIQPPTPKAQPSTPSSSSLEHTHAEQPPAYNQIGGEEQEERDWRVAAETLKKWHRGAKIPFEPVPSGISVEAVEEWEALKEELGVECMVIDKIVASSDRTNSPRLPKDGKASSSSSRRSGRFYNIYNTYVYGDKKAPSSSSGGGGYGQAVMWMGASALVFLAISPYLVPHYSVPGGPTYYDRTAWNSFNSMQAAGEGFSPDGTAAVWNFLGRVGGGAARIARGWPT